MSLIVPLVHEHQWTSTSINSCDDLQIFGFFRPQLSDRAQHTCPSGRPCTKTHRYQLQRIRWNPSPTSDSPFEKPQQKNGSNSPGPTSAEKHGNIWQPIWKELKDWRKQQDMNWTWLNHDERDSDRIQTFCWKRTGKRNLKNHNQCLVGIEKLHSPGPDTDTNNTTIDNDW